MEKFITYTVEAWQSNLSSLVNLDIVLKQFSSIDEYKNFVIDRYRLC
ncbi:MAG: hypothetical protein AAB600_05130 [Patescibacteria group bacterium]